VGHQEAVLEILKPLPNMVDANGFVLEGWGFKSIHNGMTIMLYVGHDKYDQFEGFKSPKTITLKPLPPSGDQVVKHELGKLCDGPGMELHGTIYTFKLVRGNDMAFHGGA
jgi:hypothetical protein